MLSGRLEDAAVCQVHGARQATSFFAEAGLRIAVESGGRIAFALHAMLDDGFDRQGAGHFAMGFAAHPVRNNEQVHGFDHAVAVLVVRAQAADVAGDTTDDAHTISLGADNPVEVRPHPCGRIDSTLTETRSTGKAMTPTDYSPIGYGVPARAPCELARGCTASNHCAAGLALESPGDVGDPLCDPVFFPAEA